MCSLMLVYACLKLNVVMVCSLLSHVLKQALGTESWLCPCCIQLYCCCIFMSLCVLGASSGIIDETCI